MADMRMTEPICQVMRPSKCIEGGHFESSPAYEVLRPRRDPTDGELKGYMEFVEAYSESHGFPQGTADEIWDKASLPDPPLLETKYRLGMHAGMDFDVDHELAQAEPDFFISANSTPKKNALAFALSFLCIPCGPVCFKYCANDFEVPVGAVRRVKDGNGGFLLAGSGVHLHLNPFWSVEAENLKYAAGVIKHGDWCIAVVDQGYIGLANDKGQPVLLPPGLHQWRSTTLMFDRMIDLNMPVIYLGPYTLLTVDEGYAAVTQNNGKQEIKSGGKVHLLSHRNHKFEKFL
eukprot:Sspe_Gene.58042::Locus_31837_Transcript_1_1_Confidence_1.000_Length_914::g.58042::m.58042